MKTNGIKKKRNRYIESKLNQTQRIKRKQMKQNKFKRTECRITQWMLTPCLCLVSMSWHLRLHQHQNHRRHTLITWTELKLRLLHHEFRTAAEYAFFGNKRKLFFESTSKSNRKRIEIVSGD